jgi:ribonuclease R
MSVNKKELPIEKRLLDYLAHPKYQPLHKTDLAKRLGVPVNERSAFRKILAQLEQDGRITRVRKDRYLLPVQADLLVGVIQINPRGFGYLLNETADGEGDVYISADNTGASLHRDRVVIRLIPHLDAPIKGGRQRGNRQGRVIKVLERANQTIVGTVRCSKSKNFFYVVPDDPALYRDVYVKPGTDIAVNDKVVVELEPWENRHVNPEGRIIEVLGPAGAPGVDLLSIIKKYDLSLEFPDHVLDEANKIPSQVRKRDLSGREDLRSIPVFTIDPEDARDFDDAIHVIKNRVGWEIGIHIADVSHFVKPGSALDREAFRRGNSVYLPDRVLPMLPEKLSNGVCSLRPGEDHLTKSVIVQFDKKFRIKKYRFAATVICSRNRLTYPEASKMLATPPDNELAERLHEAWKIALQLRSKRFAEGALELEMPEVRVRLGEQGEVIGLHKEPYDSSHQLIEEWMLLTNELVAKATKDALIPSLYRIHEDPDPIRLEEFREQVLMTGTAIGDLTHPREVQRLLKKIAGKPEENAIKIGLLRSLRKALYSPEPNGHYGLAKSDYTHFTSPIRRYADLLVHRAFNLLISSRDTKPIDSKRLKAISEHISATERIAADAERQALKLKKMEYFQRLIRQEHSLEAVVIEVRNYGLLVEIPEGGVTGLIHISSLERDFFVFDGARSRIFGRRTKEVYTVGNILRVRVVRVDMFKQQIDFVVANRKVSPKRG